MITFLGFIIFATVIAIGLADRHNGLRLFQKYHTVPWGVPGAARGAATPTRRRRRRAHDS